MSYGTADEVNFLKNIGIFGKNKSPIECLHGYIEASKNRVEWGFIDKDKAVNFAKERLSNLTE